MINVFFALYMILAGVLLYVKYDDGKIDEVPKGYELFFLPGAVIWAMCYMFVNEMIYMPIMKRLGRSK